MKKRTWAAAGAGAILGGLALFSQIQGRRARKAVPRDGVLLPIDGARAHVVDRGRGKGPPIVMLHGLGGQLRNFNYGLADTLSARHRVVLIDRPGSGWSTRAPGVGGSLAEQAHFVAQVIRELGLEKPLLVGHSMGGAVALATALDHPGLLGGLALVAPLTQMPHLPAIARARIVRVRALQLIWARIVAVPAITALGARRRNRIFWPETMPADFETRGGGSVMRRPDLLANGLVDLTGLLEELPGMVARYTALKLPVDILFGRDDRVLDPHHQGETTAKQIREARFVLRDGGHMLPVTQPEMVAAWVEEAAARIG